MDTRGYLEPRNRAEAKHTAVTLTLVAAGVTLFFAVVVPPPGGPKTLALAFLVPLVLIAAAVLLHRASADRPLRALWAPMPIAGIVAIAGLDLATSDATAAGQVFLCYPVIYAGSQLRWPAAILTSVVAIVADAVVVFTLLPFAAAVTDLAYVSAVLIAMTALLIRSGQKQDALVAELREQAAVDSLTGLVTRRVLDDALQSALTSAVGSHGTALVMLDVDRFKTVNDSFGHPVGDAALVHIAKILEAHTRSDTVICRIGGDEIAFLMPACPQDVARARAEQLVRLIRENPMPLPDGELLHLSVSMGVAHSGPHAESMRDLYADADAALYNAKHAGRDRVGVPDDPAAGTRRERPLDVASG